MRIKEIKISIHRKYTKNFQSLGYRIGIMLDVEKDDNPRDCYYQGKSFLNERIKEENVLIDKKFEWLEKGKVKGSKLTNIPVESSTKVMLNAQKGRVSVSNYQKIKMSDNVYPRDIVYVQDVADAIHRIMFETDMERNDVLIAVKQVKKMGVSEENALLEVGAQKGIRMAFVKGKPKEYIIKIIEETGLTIKEIQELINDKKKELRGIVSDEGALFLIAKELGVIIGKK